MWSRVPDCTRVRVESVHTYVQNMRPFICTRIKSRAPDSTRTQKSVYRLSGAQDVCTIESRLQSPYIYIYENWSLLYTPQYGAGFQIVPMFVLSLYIHMYRICDHLYAPKCGVGPRFEFTTGSCVYLDSHCDIQLWARAVHPYCSA